MTTTDVMPRHHTAAVPLTAVELAGLQKSYGNVQAVNGIDLSIPAGQVIALLGPNGAGKTTTIDMILGLAKPTQGSASIFGMRPHEAIRRGLVSAVMQTAGLLKDLTVQATVRYVASLYPTPRPVAEVMEIAGITEIAQRSVGKCSGGEQQRLRFAMALISDPALIILDEPTTGMDVASRRAFWQTIHQDALNGRTVLFATHYLDEADSYANRIVLMRNGLMVADGTPAQIKAMTSGRTIRATWKGADVAALSQHPDVSSVEIRGDSVVLKTGASDEVARYLLNSTPACDLEITSHGLEDAFVALTHADQKEDHS